MRITKKICLLIFNHRNVDGIRRKYQNYCYQRIHRLGRDCGKLNNGFQNCLIQSLETMNVTLYGKRDFADVVKVKDCEMGRSSGLCGWAWCTHRVLIRGTQEESEDKAI